MTRAEVIQKRGEEGFFAVCPCGVEENRDTVGGAWTAITLHQARGECVVEEVVIG